MGTSANAERRESTRRRFSGTVELALPDEPEGYEADAVDVSIGGMSLKTAFLPDVGSELDCRFVLDGADPRTVQARGQVVWAKDNGADAGAFGLCFTDLSRNDRAALEKHCEAKGAAPAPAAKAQPAVDPHAKTVNAAPHAIANDDRVRLRLPKMAEPLKAKIHQEVDGAVVVGMDLSFITLGDHVEVESAKGKSKGMLEDVQIDLDPKTKSARLVLTVSLDGSTAAERTGRHAALVLPSKPTAVAPADELPAHTNSSAAPVAKAKPSQRPAAPSPVALREERNDDHEEEDRPARAAVGTGTEVLSSKEGAARADAAAKTADDAEGASSLASRSSAPAWLVSALTRLRLTSKAAWEKASPAAKKAFAALVTFAMTFSAKVRAKVTGKPVALPEPPKAERATTAKAPAAGARPSLRKQKPNEAPVAEASAIDSTAPSMRRKYAMIGLGAFGLSAIVFALATAGREPRPRAPRPQVAVESTPTNSTPATPAANGAETPATTAAAGAAEPETGAQEPASESPAAQRPRAMPSDLVAAARSRNANVESEQPTIRRETPAITPAARGARPTLAAAPAAVAAGAVRPIGSAAVRSGTVLRLRLDGPIGNLTGGPAGADALSFRVQGRRVLDRAAAFVRMDPRIAGAGAYNRGGNAEFTLRFHGAAPQFSARAHGDVLEVTLAAPAASGATRLASRTSAGGVRIASMPRR